ncbi:hypothetical protein JZ751_009252 [Albula glossodonta]|uniref:Uncharacterized protein n=1 Tax=Albula glossodonta TaxID=121402 RepID=A0A8T2N3L6_9TELE|nr:hypothetical protein JZ751_009252 [Albula glossodonta]
MNITAGPDLEPGESEGAGNCECVRLPYRHLCNEIKTPSRSVPPGRGDSGERRLSLAARAECAQAQGAERHSLNSWFMSACWPGAARKSAGSISHRSAIQSLPQNKGPEGPQVCQGRGLDQSRSGGPKRCSEQLSSCKQTAAPASTKARARWNAPLFSPDNPRIHCCQAPSGTGPKTRLPAFWDQGGRLMLWATVANCSALFTHSNMGNSTTPQLQAGQCEGKESPPVEH